MMLPRIIDKARAYSSNMLGEYIFPCPLDKIILEFLDTDHNEFANKAKNLSEKEMSLWINEKCINRSEDDKDHVNEKLLGRKPDTPESLHRFNEIRNKINPINKNVSTWIDLIELEESQTLPKNS